MEPTKEEPPSTNGLTIEKPFQGIKWPSSSWEDGSRRSAFQPYKSATVLTNLQRGNIQAKTPQLDTVGFSWFEKAGRGNLAESDFKKVHDINAADIHGFTALMWSSAYGQNNTTQLLLQKGANVHIKGKRSETAMHLAAAGGHQDVIKLLISFGADADLLDEDGNSPLLYAVHGDHPHAVQELLQQGACLFDPDCYNYAVTKGCKQDTLFIRTVIVSVSVLRKLCQCFCIHVKRIHSCIVILHSFILVISMFGGFSPQLELAFRMIDPYLFIIIV